MRLRSATRLADRLSARLPRRTVRFRLTVLYGGLFLLAGAAVLTLTYVLVAHTTEPRALVDINGDVRITTAGGARQFAPARLSNQARQLREQAERQHNADLHQLLVQSTIALAVATVLAFAAGWFVAGRVLRPLRVMTTSAQRISQHNLHERLSVTGPDDEIKDLADTIDDLLGRLQHAFDAQRRFVANAAHELRTPLTWQRALVEVSLADPRPSIATLRETLTDLLSSGQDQERLIEALLTLATSERGLDRRDPVDLAALAADALDQRPASQSAGLVRVRTNLAEAWTSGDAELIKRLIGNLFDNAQRHNRAGGRVDIATSTRDGQAVLTIDNTGPVVPSGEITRLLQPFQRLTGERSGHPDGHGLGLSIVAAIAAAHDAQLTIRPGRAGGLDIEVAFPLARKPATRRDDHLAVTRVALRPA